MWGHGVVLEGYVVLLGVMLNCGESFFVGGGHAVLWSTMLLCFVALVVLWWSCCFVFYVSQ